MFQSVQRRPICGIRVQTVRLPGLHTVCSEAVGKANGPVVKRAAAWMSRRMDFLLSWLHKAGVCAGETGSEKTRKGMVSLLANQCSFVTGQRFRRAWQIGELYSNLYSERSRMSLVSTLWRRFQSKHARTSKLVAALAGVFMWEEEKIRDEELKRCAGELQAIEVVKNRGASQETASRLQEEGWEIVMDKKNFWVWKRPLQNSHLYEYKVLGTYTDITPRQFFNVQLDTEYRKKWDALVIKLEVVDRDFNTGSEVVHWATYFPYPLYSRDYVYVRRYDVDLQNNLMVLVSRAVEHPSIPESQDFVRVRSYQSKMVIRPHKSFDENGFDYLLTYSDDPQTVFPRYCVSWMVSSGMPDFLEKLHTAALRARNQEVGMQDYINVVKPSEKTSQPSPDRLGEKARSRGQIYA
ncbi:stAR-related lipid transfer protein 7, mitochondrial [Conger conger]|uniref:stAR-related lipid transfer protein 7, mitochondrial n=1 Tax=Conger conger TaxID=82655 RepID=UPI002A599903|nr:stAR-related lipid transfer protein 7, mitochondrial [Conger conger]